MALLKVERLGGLAGFGGAQARVRSRGQLETEALSTAEQQAVEALFQPRTRSKGKSPVRDGFRYKISRETAAGTETVEVPESDVPVPLAQCVRDELV